MPLFDFLCPNGHLTEELLTHQQIDASMDVCGEVIIMCPVCLKIAKRARDIELISRTNKAWEEQTWLDNKSKGETK